MTTRGTDWERAYERVAEAIDEQVGVFRPSNVPAIHKDVVVALRVLSDFVTAGLLRALDMKDGTEYVRTDVPCVVREPEVAIYRCFDVAGRLLYIGRSLYVEQRISAHAARKSWWRDVRNVTVDWVTGWDAASRAEVEAIKAERPLHNKMHNRRPLAATSGSATFATVTAVAIFLEAVLLVGLLGIGAR